MPDTLPLPPGSTVLVTLANQPAHRGIIRGPAGRGMVWADVPGCPLPVLLPVRCCHLVPRSVEVVT